MSFWKRKRESRCDETPHLLANDDWIGTEVHLFNWDGRFVITSVVIHGHGGVEVKFTERAKFLKEVRVNGD